ncbi:MAG: RNA polymerase sigma factor [Planctomycetaceae bacterium]|nr:RNA polymerase sigma factor [Planctomycetaceae bacterium]
MKSEKSSPPALEACDDAELVRRFAAGDRLAINTFVRRWEHSLLRIALRIVGRLVDAEEVRQIVLMHVIQRPDQFAAKQNIGAWLRRCAINESLMCLRRRRRKVDHSLEDSVAMQPTDPAVSEEAELLAAALRSMPPDVRALLTLRFDEGLTVRQIGETLDTPFTTIQSRLTAAIVELRARMGATAK